MAADLFAQPGLPPDAFEVGLLDAVDSSPLVTALNTISDTDAILSVQADGTVFFSNRVEVPGASESGDKVDLSQPILITVQLPTLQPGTIAALDFTLLGMGSDNSSIIIDDVELISLNSGPSEIVISSGSVPENLPAGVVGTVTVVDPDLDDRHSFGLSDPRFEIVDGQLKLADGVSLDHESEPTTSLTVTATDLGGLQLEQTFPISVLNVNEAPTRILLAGMSVSEKEAGAVVGSVGVQDPDAGDTHLFEVSDDRFEITGGQLKLKADAALDHEEAATIQLEVVVADAESLSHQQSFTIQVADLTSPLPAIASTAGAFTNLAQIPVSVDFGEVVSGFTADDIDVEGGTISNFVAIDSRRFDFEVTPASEGPVTVDVAAGVAPDEGGNPNLASSTLALVSDVTAPRLALANPAPGEFIEEDLGYFQVRWDPNGVEPGTIGTEDITVARLTIDRVEIMDDGSVRYWYSDDGDFLKPGLTVITHSDVVTDRASNSSNQSPDINVFHLLTSCSWQNPRDRFDVNLDTLLTPFDVSAIINELNNPTIVGNNGKLPDPRTLDPLPPPFVDVNCDTFGTPFDVLALINEINSRPNGEGEMTAQHMALPAAPLSVAGAELALAPTWNGPPSQVLGQAESRERVEVLPPVIDEDAFRDFEREELASATSDHDRQDGTTHRDAAFESLLDDLAQDVGGVWE